MSAGSNWVKVVALAAAVYVIYGLIFMGLDTARVGTGLPTHPKLVFYVWASALLQYLVVLLVVFVIALIISLTRRGRSYSRVFLVSVYVTIPILGLLLYGAWYGASRT